MEMLHTGFRQELDGLHSSVQQLNPEEIKEGITKISHLERLIGALDERFQEIKKMLLMGGKNTTSSSTLEGDFGLHERLIQKEISASTPEGDFSLPTIKSRRNQGRNNQDFSP